MEKPLTHYWGLRLEATRQALDDNGFEAYIVDDSAGAARLASEKLVPAIAPRIVSWGGSMTFVATGFYETLKHRADLEVIDTFDKTVSPAVQLEQRRRSLLTDLFITGTNAVTETGTLVNLDMIGNRVAALTFGPKSVLVFVGRNKIVPDLAAGMQRVKALAAPANTMRLDKQTPCAKTGRCQDCKSPDRICNTWTITEKSFPKGRIKVVLINDDLGF
jgi:L-lactate utilization protein LutB